MKSTKAHALIDRKTKKIVAVQLEKIQRNKCFFFIGFTPYEKKRYALIPVTITPVKKGKKK